MKIKKAYLYPTSNLVAPPANDATIVELRVASSKQMDCPAGVMVAVSLQDLQEMQNSFRSQIESGLASLSANQGHGGIPVAPPDAVAAPPRPTLAGVSPMSANEMSAALEEQRQQADQAEALVIERPSESISGREKRVASENQRMLPSFITCRKQK